jgi:GGDEF domain-containing protein
LYSASRDAFSEEHQRVIEVVARQVTPAVQQAAELQRTRSNVVRDRRTGLPKLESFRDLAATQITEATPHRPVSLIMIQLPDFGHPPTELYVSHAVRAVRRSLRGADMLFQYHGNDLVALLLQTDRTTGASIGNRISQAMIDPKGADAPDLANIAPPHVSVVSAPEDGTTIDELLQRASIRRVTTDDGRAHDRKQPPSIH